ncbi:hypothetical protein CYY_009900 [Polysphondylium violaceum]|uniref:RING-type domain-containing protein n=1 Tax=Polysphondylium violaceum TaxID=133409 RepID=A0A8J4V058_9MYCE|nr:hypothetical protein CYY_009900 [Polysphondylium violaceum]
MTDIDYCKEIQNQEIQVISNIFADRFTTLYNYEGISWKYNIKINVDVPQNFSIATSNNIDGKDESSYTLYPIKNLPYIELGFEYPLEYPEKPPIISLASVWLSLEQMYSVVKKLESEWSIGEMVIFKYYDWIKTEIFQYLNIEKIQIFTNEPVDLESPLCSTVSWQYQQSWDSLISTIPFLISFCKQEQKKQFYLEISFECPICCCDYSPQEMVLLDCLHFSCRDCTTSMCKINIESGSVKLLKCSHIGCEQLLDQQFIKSIVSDQEFSQYKTFLQQSKGFVRCKKCDGWGYIDNLTRNCYCTLCKYCWCTLCHEKVHYGLPCYYVAVPKDQINPKQNSFWSDRKVQPVIQEVKVIITCKKCPGCGALLDKFDGCNKISCPNCKLVLCWICLSNINGYDHFQDNSQCILFTSTLPQMEKVPIFPSPPPLILDKEKGNPKDISFCGKCKNLIFRSNNNNHSLCKYCNSSVCFLCKEFIKGTLHFSSSDCVQHGDPPNKNSDIDQAIVSSQISRINNPKRKKNEKIIEPINIKEVVYYDTSD